MSTKRRIISGTIASWARIGVTLLTQLLLVPIYLKYWDIELFGCWVAIQALVNILTTIDRGFVDYLGYEFLKIGEQNKRQISDMLWSGMSALLLLSTVETLLFCLIPHDTDSYSKLLGLSNDSSHIPLDEIRLSALLQFIGWCFFANTTGLVTRALSVFGYFPRGAWWDFLIAFFTSIVTLVTVILGGKLLLVSITTTIFLVLISLVRSIDLYRIFFRESLVYYSFSIIKGLKYLKKSSALIFRYFFENFRQQGIRLILTPLVGLSGLTNFSTTRTVSNVLQQGLLTIIYPLMPELMRFLNEKEQEKINFSFAGIWMFVNFLLFPGVIFLQMFAKSMFVIWTHDKIHFEPELLAFFSISILIYAMSQPAVAIVVGNNLTRKQLSISIKSSLVLLISLILLTKYLGLRGAGLALVLTELFSGLLFVRYAKEWLKKSNLVWPEKLFYSTLYLFLVTLIALAGIIYVPDYICLVLIITPLLYLPTILTYYRLFKLHKFSTNAGL